MTALNNQIVYRDLDKRNLICQFDFMLEPTFAPASTSLKNATHFKSGQKCPENNQLTNFTNVQPKCLW